MYLIKVALPEVYKFYSIGWNFWVQYCSLQGFFLFVLSQVNASPRYFLTLSEKQLNKIRLLTSSKHPTEKNKQFNVKLL